MLSLVVPTLNEARNLPVLLRQLHRALRSIPHEILIADDDSPDGTAAVAESLSSRHRFLRVLRRDPPRGLSASILDGFAAARGRALGVIDADLQHDPAILPELLQALNSHDLAIGSRYAFEGRTCGWSVLREVQSRLAARFTRATLGLQVRDPLSGYFLVRRDSFEAVRPRLLGRGWKLLLEILAHLPSARVAEVPFTFRARVRGETKMSRQVLWAWLSDLRRLRSLRRSPARIPPPAALGGRTG